MHFFEKQRIDAAGVLGVKLQKSLIFLGIVSLVAFFFGAFLPSVLSLALLAIGFAGAYRRRPSLLSLYFWINVTIAILGLVFVIAMMITSTQTSDMGAQSNGYSNEEIAVNPLPLPTDPNSGIPSTPYDPSASSQSSQQSSESESESNFSSSFEYSSSSSYVDYNLGVAIIVALIVSVVISVLISFFKVYSIVLAWKMRRLLLSAPTLPVSSKASTPAPSNASYPGYSALPSSPNVEVETSVALPETPAQNAQNIQGQVQMMYMPYPYNNNNNNQNGGGMMLNQYGQPVFYTYQPMNGFVPQTPQ